MIVSGLAQDNQTLRMVQPRYQLHLQLLEGCTSEIEFKCSKSVRPPPKNCYVALSRPTVKCEKTGSGFFFFFFFFMSDLGEEFAKICIQWLKKALA